MSDRFDDKKELFNDGNLSADERVEQLERYIEQMKEEIKQLKKMSKQKEKIEKLELEKKRIISKNLKSHRKHH